MKHVILTLFLCGLLPGAAFAAPICMDRDELESGLIDWYQAEPVAGPTDPATRLWVSTTSGVWALVEYRPDGTACTVQSGTDWTKEAPMAMATLQG